MNKVIGNIVGIDTSGNISLVEVKVNEVILSSMIIGNEKNTEFLEMGREVQLLFKESEVSIAKNFSGELSLRNRFKGPILKLKKGKLFTEVFFNFEGFRLTSLITTRSVNRMDLKVGEEITGLIKSNEVILSIANE